MEELTTPMSSGGPGSARSVSPASIGNASIGSSVGIEAAINGQQDQYASGITQQDHQPGHDYHQQQQDHNQQQQQQQQQHYRHQQHHYQQQPAPTKGKMFIGGLNPDTTLENLRDYFSRFGEIIDCVVVKDPTTARSRRFGFVTFSDPACCETVLATRPHMLDSRVVDPKLAVPRAPTAASEHAPPQQQRMHHGHHHRDHTQLQPRKVFVGGLPLNTNNDKLKSFFIQFGEIREAIVIHDKQTKLPRGFGFVIFENEDVARQVVEKKFIEFGDKTVEVKRAEPKEGPPMTPPVRAHPGMGVRPGNGRPHHQYQQHQHQHQQHHPRGRPRNAMHDGGVGYVQGPPGPGSMGMPYGFEAAPYSLPGGDSAGFGRQGSDQLAMQAQAYGYHHLPDSVLPSPTLPAVSPGFMPRPPGAFFNFPPVAVPGQYPFASALHVAAPGQEHAQQVYGYPDYLHAMQQPQHPQQHQYMGMAAAPDMAGGVPVEQGQLVIPSQMQLQLQQYQHQLNQQLQLQQHQQQQQQQQQHQQQVPQLQYPQQPTEQQQEQEQEHHHHHHHHHQQSQSQSQLQPPPTQMQQRQPSPIPLATPRTPPMQTRRGSVSPRPDMTDWAESPIGSPSPRPVGVERASSPRMHLLDQSQSPRPLAMDQSQSPRNLNLDRAASPRTIGIERSQSPLNRLDSPSLSRASPSQGSGSGRASPSARQQLFSQWSEGNNGASGRSSSDMGGLSEQTRLMSLSAPNTPAKSPLAWSAGSPRAERRPSGGRQEHGQLSESMGVSSLQNSNDAGTQPPPSPGIDPIGGTMLAELQQLARQAEPQLAKIST